MAYRKILFYYKIIPDIVRSSILQVPCPKILQNNVTNRNFCYTSIKYTTNNTSTISNLEAVKENVNLDEFKRKNFTGLKYLVQSLQKLLNISHTDAKLLIKDYPILKRVPYEIIESNYNLYIEEGVRIDIIMKYPNLLSLTECNLRIKSLKQMPLNLNSSAPLLLTNINVLKRIVRDANEEKDIVPHGNRISYLSKMLKMPAYEISEKLIKHHYILRIPFERLERVLKILIDYGVEPQNIMSDFWSLRYSPELAEKRMQQAINANVHKVKTWMIRCPDQVFDRCINRQVVNRKILGSDSSVEEYLSKRLECTVENAKYLTEKYPALEKMNISKMKEIMDYLFDQSYTPGHICRVPRILIHSLETTKSRLIQLKHLGYVPPSLAILCKSKRDYDKYIKKYNKKQLDSDNKGK